MNTVRAILAITAGRATASLIYTIALILLARWSGVEQFGRISGLIGLSMFLAAVLDLGLTPFLLRERALVVKGSGDVGAVRQALNITKVSAVSLFVLCALAGSVLLHIDPIVAVLVSLGAALDKFSDSWQAVLIAEQRNARVNRILLQRRLSLLAIFVVLYLLGADPLVAFGVSLTAAGILNQWYRRPTLRSIAGSERSGVASVLRRSRSYWVALVSAQARELDNLVVLAVTSGGIAGTYAAAARLSRPALLLAGAVANVLLPHLTVRNANDARRASALIGGVGVMSAVGGALLSPVVPEVIDFLFGDQYVDAALPATVLLITIGPTAMCSAFGSALQAHGHARVVATNGVVFALMALTALAAGAYFNGALGAAVGIGTALSAKFLVLWLHCLRRLERAAGPSL